MSMSQPAEATATSHGLRWLHLTDFHVGKQDESQATALGCLISAIANSAAGKPFDLVVISGDLAFSGRAAEYEQFDALLLQPLKRHALCRNATFFATPGNHDLDCDIGFPPVWNAIGRSRQENFFHLDDSGRKTRSARAQAFTEYAEYLKRSSIKGVDPTTHPAAAEEVLTNNGRFTIVTAVTAFFSDKEVSDFQKAPAPIHAIRTILQGLPKGSQTIIIGHHPPDWFTAESARHLHTLLVEHDALYVHGHEHRVSSKFGSKGLTCLGFGAAYQAPSDSPPTPYYRNSFAICELEDSLHVQIVSWDAEHGQWRPDQAVPGDFTDRSDRLRDGYRLTVPTTKLIDRAQRPYASLALAIRNEVHVESCIWLADNDPKRWTDLLLTIGQLRNVTETYELPTQTLPVGHIQFRVRDQRGLYLVRAVTGHGDILNYEQLEAINTELDRQDYDGCIVITLGELAAEARTLAKQLASRKSINVLERSDVARQVMRNLPAGLDKAIGDIEPNTAVGSLIVTATGFALLLQERTNRSWFHVLAEDGIAPREASDLVFKLREQLPPLRTLRYEITRGRQQELAIDHAAAAFDRAEYLEKSYAYFDDVKYAPLAALGFRFRKASLSEIYVDALADVGGSSKTSHNLTRAVSEFVESLNLPQAQRDQLESQLRSRHGLNRTAEVGAARKLYQRYNNVIVLGDPGSGKTCFVKHEILAYCQPPDEQRTWYAQHLPIYVSLAEAARLLNEDTGLLAICEIVSSRRGIALPLSVIESALADGRAAFFFDGLDEVGYLDRRIALMAEIDRLVKTFAPRGNRFVLASRPAAVQPVDIPEALTYLQLKGLTEDEIRVLAGRVLTVRLGEHEQTLSSEEADLVERLLEDTRTSPGIARIARNPLLLTLLVLIYANTGALSARRHLIYTQAIKTLVSVRGRQTKEQQLSEADLRTRLGALALAIFTRETAEIPKRSEVVRVIGPLLPKPLHPVRSERDVTDGFLQEVAEATGLLVIHSEDNDRDEDLITFMHYSFLEYYAAAGLLSRDYGALIAAHSSNPRWKDVTTLLFGILSEQTDVTPILAAILTESTASESISKYKTLLALDCAAECDVPPEAAQDVLATSVYETVANGAGRYSAELRMELARRLEYFIQGAGPRLEHALTRGLSASDAITSAAFADLIARLSDTVTLSSSLTAAFGECLKHTNAVTRAAAMFAIERRPELRTPDAKTIVIQSLTGSVIEKHAALKVIAAVPLYQDETHDALRKLLDDPNTLISGTAAQCMLVSALRGRTWRERDVLQEKILIKIDQCDQDTGLALDGITLDKHSVERLITSTDSNESELAIRYAPLVRDDDEFVYRVLLQRLRETESPRQRAACMDSLRESPGAIALITLADTDLICSQLKADNRMCG